MESVRRQREKRIKREREEPGAGLTTLESNKQMIAEAVAQTVVGPRNQTRLRLAVMDMMTSPDFQVGYCNFDYIHKLRPIKKSSASETSVFFGTLTEPPVGHSNDVEVSVKLSFKTSDLQLNNSLPMERLNYQMIANTVILNEWSPHLIAYVASFSCARNQLKNVKDISVVQNVQRDLRPILDRIQSADQQLKHIITQLDILDQMDEIVKAKPTFKQTQKKFENEAENLLAISEMYDTTTLDFLITEKAHNAKSLGDWLDAQSVSGGINLMQLKSIVWQILYTFEVFNRIGFRHNDAHVNNILIENWSTDKAMLPTSMYNVDGEVFQVPTKSNFVKIFDFDHSSFSCDPSSIHPDNLPLIEAYKKHLPPNGPKECNNTLLDNHPLLCRGAGKCNTPNNKYDSFLTLRAIWFEMQDRLNKDQTADVMFEWLDKQLAGAVKYVWEDGNDLWLRPDHVPTDEEMPTPLMMLRSGFFDEFKITNRNVSQNLIYSLPLAPL